MGAAEVLKGVDLPSDLALAGGSTARSGKLELPRSLSMRVRELSERPVQTFWRHGLVGTSLAESLGLTFMKEHPKLTIGVCRHMMGHILSALRHLHGALGTGL